MVVSSLLAKAKIQVGSNVFWMRRKLCITPVLNLQIERLGPLKNRLLCDIFTL